MKISGPEGALSLFSMSCLLPCYVIVTRNFIGLISLTDVKSYKLNLLIPVWRLHVVLWVDFYITCTCFHFRRVGFRPNAPMPCSVFILHFCASLVAFSKAGGCRANTPSANYSSRDYFPAHTYVRQLEKYLLYRITPHYVNISSSVSDPP